MPASSIKAGVSQAGSTNLNYLGLCPDLIGRFPSVKCHVSVLLQKFSPFSLHLNDSERSSEGRDQSIIFYLSHPNGFHEAFRCRPNGCRISTVFC